MVEPQYTPDRMNSLFEVAGDMARLPLESLHRQIGHVADVARLVLAPQPEQSSYGQLESDLKHDIVGQDDAIDALVDALNCGVFHEPGKPAASLLFLGPTGVGKTETVKALDRRLHPEGSKLTRIDCSGFQFGHNIASLIGAPPGYVGRNQTPKLDPSRIKGDKHIILFDEFEKGHETLRKLMLQILEEGELQMQNSDKVTRFDDCILVFTTNTGASEMMEIMSPKSVGFTSVEPVFGSKEKDRLTAAADKELKRTVEPELINRFDARVVFGPLNDEQLVTVIGRHVESKKKAFKNRGIELTVSDALCQEIVRSNPERKQFGGRAVVKSFKKTVLSRLGHYVSAGSIPAGSRVHAVLTAPKTEEAGLQFDFYIEPDSVQVATTAPVSAEPAPKPQDHKELWKSTRETARLLGIVASKASKDAASRISTRLGAPRPA